MTIPFSGEALFSFLTVAGFANFQLISYYLKVESVVSDVQIPVFYAIAMGVDARVALIIGKTYDKIGLTSLITIPLLTLPDPLFAFSHSYTLAVIGIVFWGALMGIHETIMGAANCGLNAYRAERIRTLKRMAPHRNLR